jgi:hypothetical protein
MVNRKQRVRRNVFCVVSVQCKQTDYIEVVKLDFKKRLLMRRETN